MVPMTRPIEKHDIFLLIWSGLFLIPAYKIVRHKDWSYWQIRLRLLPLALFWAVLYMMGFIVLNWFRS
jgi:hypothetical protein